MAKFASIEEGARARKPVTLPLLGSTYDVEKAEWVGAKVELAVCALGPGEDIEILRQAREYAASRGVAKPEAGEPIYDYAVKLHTLVASCLDVDSPLEKPEPFFGSVAEITKSKVICQDQVNYLYEVQREHQDTVAPRPGSMSHGEFMAAVVHVAGGDLDFFGAMRPSMQWSFTRTLAALYISSQAHKSPSSQDGESSSTTDTPTGGSPPQDR